MAIIFNNKKGKTAKASNNHVYSGFWLDKNATSLGDFYAGRNNDTVKALKLRKYQRAIANFVKILSQRDVPVIFKGTNSYTDNQHVTIATDISDKNFDVYAGLALHEASHLKYTNFNTLKHISALHGEHSEKGQRIKEILNYVEDRRIDNLVFKSSPGYKAYYHKLYDHYFRTEEMGLALKANNTVEFESYMVHLIGMLHPEFKPNALPGLMQITKTVDINNIDRLKSTEDALTVAEEIYNIIMSNLPAGSSTPQESEEEEEGNSAPNGKSQGGSSSEEGEGEEDGEDGEGEEEPEMSPSDRRKAEEAVREARKLINGEVDKKVANRSLQNKIANLQDAPIDFTPVGQGFGKRGYDCLINETYKLQGLVGEYLELSNLTWSTRTLDQRNRYEELANMMPKCFSKCSHKTQDQYILEGVQLGAILGRKLLTRREAKSLEQNRLRSGKIDSKRIAHAGYGIETVFNQIHIDKYKQANIHLTLDASGSMAGSKWYNSVKLAAALGKAVSMIDGLELQISTRDTEGHNPVVSIVYDSRVNKLNFLNTVLSLMGANSMTPEGLCLEAMINKKLLIPSTSEKDSYLINICDGEPGHEGYYGHAAIRHTANQVRKINNELGIKHIGYFFGQENYGSYRNFKQMYGEKQSKCLPDASNAMQIADHMNKQLMSK